MLRYLIMIALVATIGAMESNGSNEGVITALVCFSLTNEPIKLITLEGAQKHFPDFVFNQHKKADTIAQKKYDDNVHIINVQACSSSAVDKYTFWIPYEFIFNTDEVIKVQYKESESAFVFKCNISQKDSLRLSAIEKIKTQYKDFFTDDNQYEDLFFEVIASSYEMLLALKEKKLNEHLFEIKAAGENLLASQKDELTKQILELKGTLNQPCAECYKKNAQYDAMVWYKNIFAGALLISLVSLIGCLLKMQEVFI